MEGELWQGIDGRNFGIVVAEVVCGMVMMEGELWQGIDGRNFGIVVTEVELWHSNDGRRVVAGP